MFSHPKKILVATELAPTSANEVLSKAAALADSQDTIDVLYVVDPASVEYTVDPSFGGSVYEEIYQTAMDNAERRLAALCKPHAVTQGRCHVRYGRVAQEVHAHIVEGGYDCLIVGSHGRSGWQLLLGSKATSILHGAPVNTWVVRIKAAEPR